MASYTIPEEIIGIPLFVPDTYNFFSVETAGLPNGDDCLKILGATNSDYKAFQAAQSLSPAVFGPTRLVGNWAMTCWIKGPQLGGSGTLGDNVLFGVMNAANANLTTNTNFVWALAIYLGGGIRRVRAVGTASASGPDWPSTGLDSTWHLYVMNHTDAGSSGAIDVYLDNSTSPTSSSWTGGVVANNFYFCIGSYSDQGTMDGWDQDWYLGKLAFHDHVLNSTERALLYNAMWA